MYVYILKCADDSNYTGVTNNLEKRVKKHQQGIKSDCYTHSRRPVELVFYEICSSPEYAIQLEKKIKGWTRKKKEAIINDKWNDLIKLAKCKDKSSHIIYKNKTLNTPPFDYAQDD